MPSQQSHEGVSGMISQWARLALERRWAVSRTEDLGSIEHFGNVDVAD
jgi:hypothetical protein